MDNQILKMELPTGGTAMFKLVRIGGLKTKEAAVYCSLSPLEIRRLVERGLLMPNRSTRHLLFSVEQLDNFLNNGTERERLLLKQRRQTRHGKLMSETLKAYWRRRKAAEAEGRSADE